MYEKASKVALDLNDKDSSLLSAHAEFEKAKALRQLCKTSENESAVLIFNTLRGELESGADFGKKIDMQSIFLELATTYFYLAKDKWAAQDKQNNFRSEFEKSHSEITLPDKIKASIYFKKIFLLGDLIAEESIDDGLSFYEEKFNTSRNEYGRLQEEYEALEKKQRRRLVNPIGGKPKPIRYKKDLDASRQELEAWQELIARIADKYAWWLDKKINDLQPDRQEVIRERRLQCLKEASELLNPKSSGYIKKELYLKIILGIMKYYRDGKESAPENSLLVRALECYQDLLATKRKSPSRQERFRKQFDTKNWVTNPLIDRKLRGGQVREAWTLSVELKSVFISCLNGDSSGQDRNRNLAPSENFNFNDIKSVLVKRRDKTAVVDFFFDSEKLFIFILKSEFKSPEVMSFTLEERKDIDDLIKRWDNFNADFRQRELNLNEGLMKEDSIVDILLGLSECLRIDRLVHQYLQDIHHIIWIPHRGLHRIPLDELLWKIPHLSCGSFSTSYLPSAKHIMNLAYKKRNEQWRNISSIALKGRTIKRVAINPQGINIPSIFSAASVIKKSYPSTNYLEGCEANLPQVLSTLEKKDFQILDFVGHAECNMENPKQAALHLFKGDKLTLFHLQQKKTETIKNCRLVCLWACETGLIASASLLDDHVSLSSTFLGYSVGYVISTLWRVHAIIIPVMMIEFYRQLMSTKDIIKAFVTTKSWMRELDSTTLKKWLNDVGCDYGVRDWLSGENTDCPYPTKFIDWECHLLKKSDTIDWKGHAAAFTLTGLN
jgi:CHAT domain